MARLQDLPDEILFMIFKDLDFFSLYNVIQACGTFQRFITDSKIVRTVDVDVCLSINESWTIFKTFLNESKTSIKHLNLQHVDWIKKAEFQQVLKTMTSLQSLNIVGTGILMTDIENVVRQLPELRSVAVSYKNQNELVKIDSLDIDELHVVLELPELRKFVFCSQVLKCLHNVDLTIEIINCPPFTPLVVGIVPAVLSTMKCKSIFIKNIPMLRCQVVQVMLLMDPSMYDYVMIENSLGIYLTSNVCPGLTDDTFIQRVTLGGDTWCFSEGYLMNVLGVSAHCQDLSKYEKIVRERLKIRTSEMAILPDEGCLLSKTEPITQHLINTTTYKQLVFTPLDLCKQVSPGFGLPTSPSETKKKKYYEAQSSETDIFHDIISSNKDVESLNVLQHMDLAASMRKGLPMCCGGFHGIIEYNMNSLLSIAALKNLRHLSLTAFPNDCLAFAKELFTNCHHLKSLQAGSPKFHRIEAFTEQIHLSTSIQVIYLRTCLRQIDFILANLSKAPSLHTIAIQDDKDIIKQSHTVSLACLMNLINKCTKLTHLNIYQEVLPEKSKKDYKRFERLCKKKSLKLSINLTKPFQFNLNNNEHYDMKFPASESRKKDFVFSALV